MLDSEGPIRYRNRSDQTPSWNALPDENELRVPIPTDLMNRMQKAATGEAARREGVDIARKLIQMLRPSVQGVQLSAPFGQYQVATDVLL